LSPACDLISDVSKIIVTVPFYKHPGKLWIVRTENGSLSHLAESAKDRDDRHQMATICGCSVRRGTEYKEAVQLKDVTCKRCKKAQRVYELGTHGERWFSDSLRK
jgi:hypothetical protein